MSQNAVLSDFDKFDNSTKEALVIIGNNILLVSQYFYKLNFVLAILGIFINAFHIIILSRKPIIFNVINVIMLGIAISDTVNLSCLAYEFITVISESFEDECASPQSSLITRLGTEIYQSYVVLDGVLKIVPAIVLPILAVLLIRELKKAEVSRKKMSVSSQSANNSDNTSKLVIIMTITCICAEGPMGIAFVLEGLVDDVPKLREIVTWFESIIYTSVILNATTHFIVCLRVSTPYRKTVKELFGHNGSQNPITITPKISSASIVTQRQVDARIDG
ncbi:Protein CBG10490 [Caenorhabditis briggsae]|uniref:Protein CBG10490 n=1 Tax=Caenorhabditis briggsae TaxID=6238 RepID=A8XAX4_CAEBR|nr:Protein CBG10490 [Caenorhabditis briggsae]CAP29902.2 Protein CBG10490 [Caenorhabditis briggsae]